MSITDYPETISPSREDADLAKNSSRVLSRFAKRLSRSPHAVGAQPSIRVQVQGDGDSPDEETVSIPASAFRLFMDILNQMAKGNAITLIPVHAELTTQEAAEILNVSRPFVVKLIDDKKLPCKMVGTHRRVLFSDLMDYKKAIDRDRLKSLDELAKQAQELNMGY